MFATMSTKASYCHLPTHLTCVVLSSQHTTFFFFFFFAVLGFKLRAYTLSHSTSPFFVKVFFRNRVS
jgi:hypothetical protein